MELIDQFSLAVLAQVTPMKRLILLLSLGFVLPASAQEKVNVPAKQDVITISPETTRVTGPLDSRGFVNYAEYLNQQHSKSVTPDTNAAVLYWKAIGPENEATTPEFRNKVVEKLGVDVFAGPGPFLTGLGDVAKNAGNSDLNSIFEEQETAMEGPWKRDDHPILVAWLDANEKPLKLVAEGSARKHYYNPVVLVNEGDMLLAFLLPNVQMYREMARMYQARAMLALGEGNVEQARQDLLTMHRVARHTSQGCTLIESLVAIAIDSIAFSGDLQLALHGKLTGPELTDWRKELAALPPMQSIKNLIDEGERYFSLDATQGFARAAIEEDAESINLMSELGFSGGGASASFTSLLIQFGYDWDVVLTMMNAHYDRMVQLLELPTHQERKAALDQLEAEMNGKAKRITSVPNIAKFVIFGPEERGRQMSTVLLSLLTPALSAAMEAENRELSRQDLWQVGLAIEAYRADKDQLPQNLNALTPNYLKSLPKDRYNDQPLNYRVRGNEYAVYSVGRNLTDNKGMTFGETEGDADDIVFRTNGWAKK